MYIQLLQTGDGTGDRLSRHRSARCGNPSLEFVEPKPPAEDNVSSPDQKYFRISATPTNRGRKRWSPRSIPPPWCGNLNLISVEAAPPGGGNISSPDQKCFHTSATPTNRGRKRWPPDRYRSPRWWGSPNLGFEKPATSGEDKVPSLDQKSFHTATTPTNRGQKRLSPGSIPRLTVWKLQREVRGTSTSR